MEKGIIVFVLLLYCAIHTYTPIPILPTFLQLNFHIIGEMCFGSRNDTERSYGPRARQQDLAPGQYTINVEPKKKKGSGGHGGFFGGGGSGGGCGGGGGGGG